MGQRVNKSVTDLSDIHGKSNIQLKK